MYGKKKQNNDLSKGNMRWLGAGFEFGGVVCLFCFFGYKMDVYFQSLPYFMIVGFFVSFAGMLYLFYKDSR